ncbi:MAG: hypothetical protein VX579_06320 [Nitrospinota bacterium]|nr:hypothetical protein [Nitrospinota bacterium]
MGEKPIEETAGKVGKEREGTFNGLPRILDTSLYQIIVYKSMS